MDERDEAFELDSGVPGLDCRFEAVCAGDFGLPCAFGEGDGRFDGGPGFGLDRPAVGFGRGDFPDTWGVFCAGFEAVRAA